MANESPRMIIHDERRGVFYVPLIERRQPYRTAVLGKRHIEHLSEIAHSRYARYQEQYFKDAVDASAGGFMPPPSAEKSHGIDSDYRCSRSLVRRRRILGPQSRSLVTNGLFHGL